MRLRTMNFWSWRLHIAQECHYYCLVFPTWAPVMWCWAAAAPPIPPSDAMSTRPLASPIISLFGRLVTNEVEWNHQAEFLTVNYWALWRNGGWASVGKREYDFVKYEGSYPERKHGADQREWNGLAIPTLGGMHRDESGYRSSGS